MPRKPRTKSPTGFYHVTLRGNGGQMLFDNDDDRRAFLQILAAILPKHNIRLLAWCLMGNHVHLLVDDTDDKLSAAMHAITVSFAGRYNARAGHIGHVFQERFNASTIAREEHLLEAIRYIHMNPQKAGLARYDDYKWSSHGAYARNATDSGLIDAKTIEELFPTRGSYLKFMESNVTLPYRPNATAKVSEDDVSEIGRAAVKEVAGCSPMELKSASKVTRNAAILALKNEGFTIRQIQLITGIGRWIICNAA